MTEEQLYDRAFVEAYTQGFDELAAHVVPYTPEWAARETEIPAERIRAIAREFADYAPRAVIYRGTPIVLVLERHGDAAGDGHRQRARRQLGYAAEVSCPTSRSIWARRSHRSIRSPTRRASMASASGIRSRAADDGAYVEMREAVLADRSRTRCAAG